MWIFGFHPVREALRRRPRQVVTRLYLRILSRHPLPEELNVAERYFHSGIASSRGCAEDLIQERAADLVHRILDQGSLRVVLEAAGVLIQALQECVVVEIATGISDGLNIEVTSGVQEGDKIVQRPPRDVLG